MPTKKELEDKVSMLNDALEAALAVSPETDNTFFTGGLSPHYDPDRSSWDRNKIFSESLRAWRVNPIARRIVKLTSAFIVGKSAKLMTHEENTELQDFLNDWAHKNKFKKNLKRWKDEDTRTGNLFFLFNVLEDGMTIIRAVPAEMIKDIETNEKDIETELRYIKDEIGEEFWPAYDPNNVQPGKTFMMHFASNQPVGSPWGEADLSPLLIWIGRFSSWLEDRVRLNRFRTAFMYAVQGEYKNEADRSTREKHLNANPPKSGSVLVTNKNSGEQWGVLSAQLDAFDANTDGLAIKKMIASGVGFPLHWLAEPESATRTTAEAAGTPSFRTLEEAQSDYFEIIAELATVAANIAGFDTEPGDIWMQGSDITERDNATLALALGRAFPVFAELLDRDAIDDNEFMRLVYKMVAEVWEDDTRNIKRKPLPQENTPAPADTETDDTDPQDDSE